MNHLCSSHACMPDCWTAGTICTLGLIDSDIIPQWLLTEVAAAPWCSNHAEARIAQKIVYHMYIDDVDSNDSCSSITLYQQHEAIYLCCQGTCRQCLLRQSAETMHGAMHKVPPHLVTLFDSVSFDLFCYMTSCNYQLLLPFYHILLPLFCYMSFCIAGFLGGIPH